MPHGNRPPATEKSHTIMDLLADLRERLNTTGGKKDSFSSVEAYDGLVKRSEHGRDCHIAERYKLLFFKNDYDEVKRLIDALYSTIHNTDFPPSGIWD
jgi:hypothetical protein